MAYRLGVDHGTAEHRRVGRRRWCADAASRPRRPLAAVPTADAQGPVEGSPSAEEAPPVDATPQSNSPRQLIMKRRKQSSRN